MADYSLVADIPSWCKDEPLQMLGLTPHAESMLLERKYRTVTDVATTIDQCPAAMLASWQSGAHTMAEILYRMARYCCLRKAGLPLDAGSKDAPAMGHADGKGWATTGAQVSATAPEAPVVSPNPFRTRIARSFDPDAESAHMVALLDVINSQVLDSVRGRFHELEPGAHFHDPVRRQMAHARLIDALNTVAPEGFYFGLFDGTYGFNRVHHLEGEPLPISNHTNDHRHYEQDRDAYAQHMAGIDPSRVGDEAPSR